MKTKKLWNNNNIDVVEIDGRWFALDGWNGESWFDCWETDPSTFSLNSPSVFIITPIYEQIGDDFEISSYKIIEEI